MASYQANVHDGGRNIHSFITSLFFASEGTAKDLHWYYLTIGGCGSLRQSQLTRRLPILEYQPGSKVNNSQVNKTQGSAYACAKLRSDRHRCTGVGGACRLRGLSGRKSVFLIMSREIRYSSEKLANILNHPPFPGQADELKRFLSECSANGFSLAELINYKIPRYHGRTVVHISANNGLFECLEELLRLGGEYMTYGVLRLCFRCV